MSEITEQLEATEVLDAEELEALLRPLYEYGVNKKITDGSYDKSLGVRCINGTFVGRKTENVIAYKGIPFVGRQPVGDLRWKAPVDCIADDGVYEAYYNANSPFQNVFYDELPAYEQGEDCLYLDIWKADEASEEKKPVMVWIHGGAFEAGTTAYPPFECHNFVKENPEVIIVSIAYRLGVFGFFHLSHLPDGKDYPDAQNLGLMDQMMALKWVHENIAGFGGDPDNVTIWGESAGAASVTLLPLIESSREYFKRVIAHSGSPIMTRSTEEAIGCTDELMDALGCKTVADLQKVDVHKLVEASTMLVIRVDPERDGNYLPLDPFAAYAKGAAKDIEFLQGCMKKEFTYFELIMGEEGFKTWAADRKKRILDKLPDEEKELVLSFCNDVKGEGNIPESRLFDQAWFNVPVIRLSESQAMNGGKSYTYYFTAEPGHGEELLAVFNHQEMAEMYEGRVFDETFARTMRRMWVQFAKTGNPSLNADNSPEGKANEWPPYDQENRHVMIFDEFDIHPEKETGRKMVDWDRTCFLPDYLCW